MIQIMYHYNDGQSLIKFTKKIANNFYNKELEDDKDYCIYIDTDSVFYSIPLIEKRFPGEKLSEVMMTQRILEINFRSSRLYQYWI